MVNAQEWLDKEYPKNGEETTWNEGKKRSSIKQLYFKGMSLEGALDLRDFVNLEELDCRCNELTSLNLNNNSKLIKLRCSTNCLTYLDLINCSQLTELHCYENEIISLDVSNCPQLVELNCGSNQLSSLILDCSNLAELTCLHNHLTSIDLSRCNELTIIDCHNNLLNNLNLKSNFQLESMWIYGNNFVEQNLSFLSHLVNLKNLYLGNSNKKRSEKLVYNRFIGSLEALKNLTQLNQLDIENTDISTGLEYLPESLQELNCTNTLLAKVLKPYREPTNCDNQSQSLQNWRISHSDLVANAQEVTELENILTNLNSALTNQVLPELTEQTLQVFIFQTEERIKELRKQNQEHYEAQIEQLPE